MKSFNSTSIIKNLVNSWLEDDQLSLLLQILNDSLELKCNITTKILSYKYNEVTLCFDIYKQIITVYINNQYYTQRLISLKLLRFIVMINYENNPCYESQKIMISYYENTPLMYLITLKKLGINSNKLFNYFN